jgi:hypothetical protein
MTNIVRHPAIEAGQKRLIRSCREQLSTQRDRAVLALNTALASLIALQGDRHRGAFAPVIESFRVAAEAFAKIDPMAPPDAALVARMAEALDRLAQLTINSGII